MLNCSLSPWIEISMENSTFAQIKKPGINEGAKRLASPLLFIKLSINKHYYSRMCK